MCLVKGFDFTGGTVPALNIKIPMTIETTPGFTV